MKICTWPIPKNILKHLTPTNYQDLAERFFLIKKTLIVNKEYPLEYYGYTNPQIINQGDQYYLRGTVYDQKKEFDCNNSYLIRHSIFGFFDLTDKHVEFGYTEPFQEIGQNIIKNFDFSQVEDEDGIIHLRSLERKFKANIYQGGAMLPEKRRGNQQDYIISYHHFVYESSSRFGLMDCWIGNLVLKMHKNEKYHVAMRFTDEILQYQPRESFKKAHWYAPELQSLEDLSETPIAISYQDDRLYDEKLGALEKSIWFDEDNSFDRLEIYWKRIQRGDSATNEVWQVEIEQVKNRHHPDSPSDYFCKYFHAIYDRNVGGFVHMDTAMRKYSQKSFEKRYKDTKLDLKTFGKNQDRIKVIRVDIDLQHEVNCPANCKINHGGEIIDFDDFMELLIVWFGNDPAITFYFQHLI